jgi:hypothetical protein
MGGLRLAAFFLICGLLLGSRDNRGIYMPHGGYVYGAVVLLLLHDLFPSY